MASSVVLVVKDAIVAICWAGAAVGAIPYHGEPVIDAGRVKGVVAVESDLLLTLILSIVADGTHRPVIDHHFLHDELFDLLLNNPISHNLVVLLRLRYSRILHFRAL